MKFDTSELRDLYCGTRSPRLRYFSGFLSNQEFDGFLRSMADSSKMTCIDPKERFFQEM